MNSIQLEEGRHEGSREEKGFEEKNSYEVRESISRAEGNSDFCRMH